MYIGWLYTKTGTLIAFTVLFGVFLQTWEAYDDQAAVSEARGVAEGVASQLAMAAGAAPEYSTGGGYSMNIPLPQEIHGVPYMLTFDTTNYQVRIRLLGRYEDKKFEVGGFLPEAVVLRPDGSRALKAPGNVIVTELTEHRISGLRVTKTGGADDYTLKVREY